MCQEKTSKLNTSVRSDSDDLRRDRDTKVRPLAPTEDAGQIRAGERSSQPSQPRQPRQPGQPRQSIQSILIPGQDF